MKWYFWVLIVIAVIVISYLIYRSQMKNKLVDGTECELSTSSSRTVGTITDFPVSIVKLKGIIKNGVCVPK